MFPFLCRYYLEVILSILCDNEKSLEIALRSQRYVYNQKVWLYYTFLSRAVLKKNADTELQPAAILVVRIFD